MTCEQVYNVWATEPDLIQILDLRSSDEFQDFHIPGARHVSATNLDAEIRALNGRLGVLIASEEHSEELAERLKSLTDIVFLKGCERWRDLRHPTAGRNATENSQQHKTHGEKMNTGFIFHQLFEPESSTYTYLIADAESREAAIIDPVRETVERDLKLIEELDLKLRFILDTHIHADHITGADELRKRTGAKTAVSKEGNVEGADIPLEDGQELLLGQRKIRVLATPGHTNTCLSFLFEDRVFTGDALLIRGTGRTDFQQGSADTLFESVSEKLFTLPDETLVYPGHDYRGQTASSIGAEKKHNPRLGGGRSKEEFKKIMAELKLAHPKKIRESVPANLAGGRIQTTRALQPQVVDGIPEVTIEDVRRHLGVPRLIDVRRPEEFNNELGHISGAELVTLGPELTTFLEKGNRDQEIVFVCRSGGRSGQATAESLKLGYRFTANMVGGMLRWNEAKFPVERS